MSLNKTHSSRQQIGQRVGFIGIVTNFVLFGAKFVLGLLGNSVSILADAFNNLTDCASSVVAIIGFKLCEKQADEKYPNGYGRMEYISGFIVSFLIMLTAFSFAKSSVERIFMSKDTILQPWFIWVSLAAIIIKLVLALYMHKVNKVIESATVHAMFKDNISDALMTLMTLVPLILAPFTNLPLDGIVGLLISIIIMLSGLESFKEHLSLLLGKGFDKKLLNQIEGLILKQEDFFSKVETISTYDFGPEKKLAFIQVDLKTSPHLKSVQVAIQELTSNLKQEFNLDATIYWDNKNHK